MNDQVSSLPAFYKDIQLQSDKINFSMPSDLQTGCLLRTLVSTKPNGHFLELGTGTGLSLSWIVEAMDKDSTVISIDNNEEYLTIAKSFFSSDQRVNITCADGDVWLKSYQGASFDLIFADAWPGKYSTLHEALSLLKVGGLYVIDDMKEQPNWPEGHDQNVHHLLGHLDTRTDIRLTKMNWSTGVVVVCRIR